jgi:hypothetical protein
MKQIIFTSILIFTFCFAVFAQDSSKKSQGSKIPQGEANFTREQLKDYYKVYENDDVKYLRRIFNRFLAKPLTKNDQEINLLKKIDKQYLKSKFTVLSRNPDMFGNVHIMLVFSDKPDKVFLATVYKINLRLDRFEEDKSFNEEDLKRIKIRYRKFLEDKKHAM